MGGPLSTKLSALNRRWSRLCRRLYLQEGVVLRRCWGTCASPAFPWPPSSLPCTRRPSPQSAGPASSRTTVAHTLRPPSLLGGTAGGGGGRGVHRGKLLPVPLPAAGMPPAFRTPLPAPSSSQPLGDPAAHLRPPRSRGSRPPAAGAG